MPSRPPIDIVDSTWLDVRPARLGAVVADPPNWRSWWPDLDLVVDELRGDKGVRWTVRGAGALELAGSMEVWLEAVGDGVVAHFFLRLDATVAPLAPARAERLARDFRRAMKRVFWDLSDRLDPGRLTRVAPPVT